MEVGRIAQIEGYVRESMSAVVAPALLIAHDFKHVDRVRGWELRVAEAEGVDLELVEATALLHDIGLTRLEVEERNQHAQVGADLALEFLEQKRLFTQRENRIIAAAIRGTHIPLRIIPRTAPQHAGSPPIWPLRVFT